MFSPVSEGWVTPYVKSTLEPAYAKSSDQPSNPGQWSVVLGPWAIIQTVIQN